MCPALSPSVTSWVREVVSLSTPRSWVGPGALGLGAPVVPAHASLYPFLGVFAADPFDSLLLTSDLDAQPCSKPNLLGELLNSDSLAAQPASFPSTHSAPPPACSTDFLQLGE